MTARALLPLLSLVLVALGALGLVAEMAWSVWKFHAFTPMFWILAWIVIVIAFLLRSQTQPPRPSCRERMLSTLLSWGIASLLCWAGWSATPALNAWLQRL